MTTPSEAWDELAELSDLLGSFDEGEAAEYVGVQLMKQSLEQRRTDLLEVLLAQHGESAQHLDVMLGGAGATSRGVEVGVVVDLLHEVQESLAAVANAVIRGPRRVRVSRVARQLAAMRLSVALPGSLALRLVPAAESLTRTQVDLFGEHDSVLEQSVGRFLDFFSESSAEPEPMLSALSEMGPRTAVHLRRLVRRAAISGTDTRLLWRSPRGNRDAAVSAEAAGRIYEFLGTIEESETEITLVGRLVGGSLVRRRFELELPDQRVISGSVELSLLGELEELFGKNCEATLIETAISVPGGASRQSRTLVGLTTLQS